MNTYPSITEDMKRGNANYYDSPKVPFLSQVILLPMSFNQLSNAFLTLVASSLELLLKVTSFSVFQQTMVGSRVKDLE